MRIAILTDEALPLGVRNHAKMLHELAVELLNRGHSVIIITPGDPFQETPLIFDRFENVDIWRFKSGYTRGVGMLKRLINEYFLSFKAWYAISSEVNDNPFDLCINFSPTIFFGPLARKLKKRGAYIYLILRDMFPQWAVDRGLLSKASPLLIFLRYYEKLNYKTADWIGVQSPENKVDFLARFRSFNNVSVLMNWRAVSGVTQLHKTNTIRQRLNLEGKVIFSMVEILV